MGVVCALRGVFVKTRAIPVWSLSELVSGVILTLYAACGTI